MNENNGKPSMVDRFTVIAGKIANITYLQVLKNTFQTIIPLFILAGFGVLLNSVIFPLFAEGELLTDLQSLGTLINNATLNISGILVTSMIAYYLSSARRFESPIPSILVAISSLFAIMPLAVEATPEGAEELVTITGALTFDYIGTEGMIAGIIIGFLATEIFIKLSSIDKLKINLGEGVPPSVSKSFSVLVPIIMTVTFFAIIASILTIFWDTNILDLIATVIQQPLLNVGTSLGGFLLIFSIGNFLFTLGIHHSVVNSSILQPLLLVNMNQNMAAASAGEEVPNIINESFRVVFGQIGGTGSTFALLLVILIFSKYTLYKNVTKLALGPSLFHINEPVIFGLPIVFNIPLMIPFILAPIVSSLIGYFATWIGFIEPFSVLVPWTTPPLIDAFLASGGDWRTIIVQVIAIGAQFLLFIPFLRISEKVAIREAESAEEA